jgi:P27 family predicted phage terminase small subunit
MKPISLLSPSTIAKGGASMKQRLAGAPKFAQIVIEEPPSIIAGDELACQAWRDVASFLNANRVMTVADINQLVIYCSTWADWVRDEEEVKRAGRVVCTERGGMQKHPLIAVIAQNKLLLNQMSKEFGMTPASRAKVSAAPEEKKVSEFAED